MKFNKFYIQILIRIVLIVCTSLLFVFFVNRDDNILTTIFIATLVFIQTILLLKYVNKTNNELAEFLIHLQQGDTSAAFSKENIEKTFKGLHHSFEEINNQIRNTRKEKEQKEHYLKYIINNVKTGLVAINEKGNIEFINKQAKIYLNKKDHQVINIYALDKEITDILTNSKLSSGSTILKRTINNDLFYLAFNQSEFKFDDKQIKLFTIHDVKNEMEKNEVEAWQKLTSVLTHEMMNSITPITSLAHAIKRYLINDTDVNDAKEINNEIIADVITNADIIENRGKGLLEFINNYRTITKLPKPKFEEFDLQTLLNRIIHLFENDIIEKKINVKISINPENLKIVADKGMIEQVLINLIKNASEAFKLTEKPIIKLIAEQTNDLIQIKVIDNGTGITQEIMENIFVPFFTTKKNLPDGKSGGSGIGLSLSRQIMHLHGGNIFVKSEPDKETVFTLQF